MVHNSRYVKLLLSALDSYLWNCPCAPHWMMLTGVSRTALRHSCLVSRRSSKLLGSVENWLIFLGIKSNCLVVARANTIQQSYSKTNQRNGVSQTALQKFLQEQTHVSNIALCLMIEMVALDVSRLLDDWTLDWRCHLIIFSWSLKVRRWAWVSLPCPLFVHLQAMRSS